MGTPQLSDEAIYELVELLELVNRHQGRAAARIPEGLMQAFRKAQLAPRHLPVLYSLVRRGPGSVGEVAARLGLAPATVSLLVNDLNRAGLLDRSEDDSDRRRTIVSMPEKYRRALVPILEDNIGAWRRALERLGPMARKHFVQGLRALEEESANASDEPDSAAQPLAEGQRS